MLELNFRGCARLQARQRGEPEECSGERHDFTWCRNHKWVSVGGVGVDLGANKGFYYKQGTTADLHFKELSLVAA